MNLVERKMLMVVKNNEGIQYVDLHKIRFRKITVEKAQDISRFQENFNDLTSVSWQCKYAKRGRVPSESNMLFFT